MDEKDKQLYEATLVVESAKQTAELGKDVVSDIIRPTSKSIGKNIGLLVDGVFGWLGAWGQKQKIKQEKYIEEFKNEINKNIEAIPLENLKEPTMCIVGPAIETSKYYYEEIQFKEMFAKLIAASCDERAVDKIHPYFVDAIKQISHKEATILALFKNEDINGFPIANYKLNLKDQGSRYYKKYVFIHNNLDDTNDYAGSLINLQRLGFVSIDFSRQMVGDEYQVYSDNEVFKNKKQEVLKNAKLLEYEFEDLVIEKGVVELSPLGENFIDLCL